MERKTAPWPAAPSPSAKGTASSPQKAPDNRPDNLKPPARRYSLLIDGEEKAGGRIDDAGAFEPPLRPPRELPDPGDAPPADWDEREE